MRFEDPNRSFRAPPRTAWVGALAIAVMVSGCHTPFVPSDLVIGPSYHPSNIYRAFPQLPPSVKRVAVLPLTTSGQTLNMDSGRVSLEPILFAQLDQTKKFEVVSVKPDDLRDWTGRSAWTAEEALPAKFFDTLRDRLGCDAVLFCRLTVYRPYPPLAIGWSLKLYQSSHPAMLWSADEVFDAGEPAVANGARRYYQTFLRPDRFGADSTMIMNSPRRFAQYSLYTLFQTLPAR